MRMIVIGSGPIGGIIGGRLARAGADITFVDIDKEHVIAIRDKGLLAAAFPTPRAPGRFTDWHVHIDKHGRESDKWLQRIFE